MRPTLVPHYNDSFFPIDVLCYLTLLLSRAYLFGIYRCRDMHLVWAILEVGFPDSDFQRVKSLLLCWCIAMIPGISRIPLKKCFPKDGLEPLATSLDALKMHCTISPSFLYCSREAHSVYSICSTPRKGMETCQVLFTTNSLSVWCKAWLPGAPQMCYCMDRILRKRLISVCEYSNYREGTPVSLGSDLLH